MEYQPLTATSTQIVLTKPESSQRIVHLRSPRFYPSISAALFDLLPQMSPDRIEQLLELGAIYLDGKRGAGVISHDTYIRVHLHPRRFCLPTAEPQSLIRFLNDDFAVVEKPAGLPVHATLDNVKENLLAFLQPALGELFPAQRLDQGTSGLMTLARTPGAHRQFQKWQRLGLIKKVYHGITNRAPPLGPCVHWLKLQARPPHRAETQKSTGAKSCLLNILSVREIAECRYRVEIQLGSGRTHQIRAQLSALDCPLEGDRIYGGQHLSKNEFYLACVSLEIPPAGHLTTPQKE